MPETTPSYRLPTLAEIDSRLAEIMQEAKVLRYLRKQIAAGQQEPDEKAEPPGPPNPPKPARPSEVA